MRVLIKFGVQPRLDSLYVGHSNLVNLLLPSNLSAEIMAHGESAIYIIFLHASCTAGQSDSDSRDLFLQGSLDHSYQRSLVLHLYHDARENARFIAFHPFFTCLSATICFPASLTR